MYKMGHMFTCLLIILNVMQIIALPFAQLDGKFGIILDAGSSSTKIRIYSWQNTLESVPKFNELFYSKIKPGISDLHQDVGEITIYLRTILDILQAELPETVWRTTPLYFMATAGQYFL